MPQPIASLSLDLDNKWSYMKTHGDKGWDRFPSYFDLVIPRILDFLQERGLRITFFVVGQDAALAKNRDALSAITAAGHEIGNHSYHHEPWLHRYSSGQIDEEIARAEEAIGLATGTQPRGFRGPGFSFSNDLFRVLIRRGYIYDATTFPTYIGPLAKAYYFFTAKLDPQQKEERSRLFGSVRDGFRPIRPHYWDLDGGRLVELPVTTMPLFRIPIHFSYLLYLSRYSKHVATAYFRSALALCRITGVRPSLLLHPLDFLGQEDDSDLGFFPAMDLATECKIDWLSKAIDLYAKRYCLQTMLHHAQFMIRDQSS